MKIGDVVWIKEEHSYGYSLREIVAETSRSWIALNPSASAWQREQPLRFGNKLPKSGKGWLVGTEREANLHSWAKAHVYKICSRLPYEHDAEIILQVAKLLGYPDIPQDGGK